MLAVSRHRHRLECFYDRSKFYAEYSELSNRIVLEKIQYLYDLQQFC